MSAYKSCSMAFCPSCKVEAFKPMLASINITITNTKNFQRPEHQPPLLCRQSKKCNDRSPLPDTMVPSPRGMTSIAGNSCSGFVFFWHRKSGKEKTALAPEVIPTSSVLLAASRRMDFTGASSTTTWVRQEPSTLQMATKPGPRAPLAANIKAVPLFGSVQKRTSFIHTPPLTGLLGLGKDKAVPASSAASMVHTLAAPLASQAAICLPSALKSPSRISLVFSPHLHFRVGAIDGSLPIDHRRTAPSVPPVMIMLASAESLAKFCSGSFPSSSVVHSHNSEIFDCSASKDRILQPDRALANQRPADAE
mmetsp:Transcript_31236/g.57118  ORF Transcript_31236/g.57118 Transcript_31236/m.57118 type:complete len:308 (-) Transcript_31236:310-1233(-)